MEKQPFEFNLELQRGDGALIVGTIASAVIAYLVIRRLT
jgi:hypothetical protein